MKRPIIWTLVILGLVAPPLWIVAIFMLVIERMNCNQPQPKSLGFIRKPDRA